MPNDSTRDIADAIARQEAQAHRVADSRTLERLKARLVPAFGWRDVYNEERRRKGLRF